MGLNERVYDKYGILALSINPGEIKTELARNSPQEFLDILSVVETKYGVVFKTLQQGASTTLVAATDPKLSLPQSDGHGVFFSDCQIGKVPAYAVGKEQAQKMWEVSEEWVGEKFAW